MRFTLIIKFKARSKTSRNTKPSVERERGGGGARAMVYNVTAEVERVDVKSDYAVDFILYYFIFSFLSFEKKIYITSKILSFFFAMLEQNSILYYSFEG